MAILALTDARTYWGGADLTGQSNKVEVNAQVDDLDATTFASGGWKECAAGLWSTSASIDGFWAAGDAGKPDDRIWTDLAVSTVPMTFAPTSGAVASVCYLTKAMATKYQTFGDIGQLMPFSVDTMGSAPLVRGQILHPQGTARTATGNGTAVQLGALTAAQKLYVNLHVTSVSGTTPTLIVKVQSNVDNTFGAPTDRLTFSSANSISGQSGTVTGAVTDTWWRVVYTIAGTTPSFTFAVSAGTGPLG